MKIELKYDDKNYYDPVFTMLYNDKFYDNFAFAICHQKTKDYSFIREDINNNFEKCEIKGTSFYYYTKENVYKFDLKDNFNLLPINKSFKHCVVLLDENDKIIEKECRTFNTILYENTNQ